MGQGVFRIPQRGASSGDEWQIYGVAAQSRTIAILKLFLGHSLSSGSGGFDPYAVRGDLETFKLVFPSAPQRGVEFGIARPQRLRVHHLAPRRQQGGPKARSGKRNPEVYEYLSNA
ncbi:hypothetical protein PG994_007028 [Apiospora phragmitis]|uniref:Uncharacterized protein n=1 Tax=Apiospora phragmitis TaxID=2905665 RepID=A0ABR1UZP0_9PEZI